MANRWSQNEELELIRNIAENNGVNVPDIIKNFSVSHNRSASAIELRLKKIIYENIVSGRSVGAVAKALNVTNDFINQNYYSYKDFGEKHGISTKMKQSTDNIREHESNKEHVYGEKNMGKHAEINREYNGEHVQQVGGSKLDSKLKKMELENRILNLVLENKDLTHKLNKLIKDGKIDKNIKELIKKIRE